jgi:hypothetical protein
MSPWRISSTSQVSTPHSENTQDPHPENTQDPRPENTNDPPLEKGKHSSKRGFLRIKKNIKKKIGGSLSPRPSPPATTNSPEQVYVDHHPVIRIVTEVKNLRPDGTVSQVVGIAIRVLLGNEKKELELMIKSTEAMSSARETIDVVRKQLEEGRLLKKLGVNNKTIEKVLKIVEKYMGIVDVAIQHHPDITALVWAGVRFIIQVSLV